MNSWSRIAIKLRNGGNFGHPAVFRVGDALKEG
jgi:hypothetical protein